MPRVSIVVPVFNVEHYLRSCLDSIALQTFRDLEVIMVDDGSTDTSAEIAESYVAVDPRFRLVRQANAGLSAARNTGVTHATGEFICFVDSDDVVARHAYELLVATLDETGSDFATANVNRLTVDGVRTSFLHRAAFTRTQLRTHITERPELFSDTTAWNKLFRRSFWDEHQLSFPVGRVFEDIPVTIPAHFLAKRVDVLSSPLYYWRDRGRGELSITQRRTEPRNMLDRMSAVLSNDEFLKATQAPEFKRLHDQKTVSSDLLIYLNQLPRADESYRQQFMDLAVGYLAGVDESAFAPLPAIDRLKYHLLLRRLMPELLHVVTYSFSDITTSRAIRKGDRFYGDYPYRDDAALAIPEDVYELGDEVALQTRVTDVFWDRDDLVIQGFGYVDHVDADGPQAGRRWLVLQRSGRRSLRTKVMDKLFSRNRLVFRAETVFAPEATLFSDQAAYDYDWSGFRARIPARALVKRGATEWQVHLLVRTSGLERKVRLFRGAPGRPQHQPQRHLPDGRRIVPYLANRYENVLVDRPVATITAVRGDSELVHLDGVLRGAVTDGTRMEARQRGGAATVPVPLTVSGESAESDGVRFTAAVAVADLVVEHELAEQLVRTEEVGPGVQWDMYLVRRPGGDGIRVSVAPAADEVAIPFGDRELAAHTTRNGYLILTERTQRPVIEATSWDPEDRLVLRGRFAGDDTTAMVFRLRRTGTGESYDFPATVADHVVTAALTPFAVDRIDATGPVGPGRWELLAFTDPEHPVAVKWDTAAFGAAGDALVRQAMRVTPSVFSYDSFLLIVEPALAPDENGPYHQHRLQTREFPHLQTKPLQECVLFESWGGKQYSDSPRAMHDELRARGYDGKVVWAFRGAPPELPAGTEVVQRGTAAYYEAFATARYIVVNDAQHPWFTRRDGQAVLQTWHGTPLKRIGFDLERVQFATSNYLDLLRHQAAQWTHLISPAPFASPIMRRSLGFEHGKLVESGLPRNDVLRSDASAEARDRVRRRLGLSDDQRVVLYAPTWRDNAFYGRGRYRFDLRIDLQRAAAALGPDGVLLIRGHHLIADEIDTSGAPDFARNVSSWPDIQELYAASDALITDYSSVFFDFANTGRPILFYCYDLEDYRDNIRGFYLDFESIAPGPIITDEDGLMAALSDLDRVAAEAAPRYEAFVRDFCAWDDGKASARALDALFGRT